MTNTKKKEVGRYQDIGDRVRFALAYAKKNTMTYKEFGAALQTSISSIHKIMHGKQKPSVSTALNICSLTGVNYEWLMTGIGEPHRVIAEGNLDISDLNRPSQEAVMALVKILRTQQ